MDHRPRSHHRLSPRPRCWHHYGRGVMHGMFWRQNRWKSGFVRAGCAARGYANAREGCGWRAKECAADCCCASMCDLFIRGQVPGNVAIC